MLSFDDYQYEAVNQYLFDIMMEKPTVKEKKNNKDSDESSDLSGSAEESEDDEDVKDEIKKEIKRKEKEEQTYRLFEEEEVLQIEEA
tara:strand:+ start:190 stop:450 length:261 start_codon:yes stop_codon:yes gene_type:complete